MDEGIRDRLREGVLAGYAVEDVRVELYDASYHDAASSHAAFRTAGFMAAEDALRQGNPVLLEPVIELQVTVPNDDSRKIADNLRVRRGEVLSVEAAGQRTIIRALAPLAEVFCFGLEVRQRTRGLGRSSMHFHAYLPCRRDGDGRDDSVVTAPLRPLQGPKHSSISLPEPDEAGGPL